MKHTQQFSSVCAWSGARARPCICVRFSPSQMMPTVCSAYGEMRDRWRRNVSRPRTETVTLTNIHQNRLGWITISEHRLLRVDRYFNSIPSRPPSTSPTCFRHAFILDFDSYRLTCGFNTVRWLFCFNIKYRRKAQLQFDNALWYLATVSFWFFF